MIQSRRALHVLVLPFLLAAILVGACKEEDPLKDTVVEMDSVRTEQRERMLRQLDEQGYVEVDTSEAKRLLEMSEKAAQNASPEVAAVLQKDAELLRALTTLVDEYGVLLDWFIEAGGIEAGGEEDSFPIRIDLLEALRDQNDLLDRRGPQLLGQMSSKPDEKSLKFMRDLRETDRRWMVAGIELLSIYHANYGLWYLDEDGTLIFEEPVPDATIERAGQLMAIIQQATEEQTQLQREHLEHSSKP
jgi:hypothetical protein